MHNQAKFLPASPLYHKYPNTAAFPNGAAFPTSRPLSSRGRYLLLLLERERDLPKETVYSSPTWNCEKGSYLPAASTLTSNQLSSSCLTAVHWHICQNTRQPGILAAGPHVQACVVIHAKDNPLFCSTIKSNPERCCDTSEKPNSPGPAPRG